MALNDIKVPKENAQGTFDEVVLTGAEIGLEKPATGNASSTQVVLGNDTRLSDARTPSSTLAHASSHAAGGSDPLAPSDIGAQSSFVSGAGITGATTLTAGRAVTHDVSNFGSSPYTILLPVTGSLEGDIRVFRSTNMIGADVEIQTPFIPNPFTVGTLTAVGQQLRFIYLSGLQEWRLVPVDSHPANRIVSGTLDIARIPTGTSSTQVSLGDHEHGNITTDGKLGSTAGLPVVTTTAGAVTTLALGTANQVLRVNSGATGVEFADPSGGGVTGAASSASDVLGVSGANITGVDANADRIIFWDDSASALKHLTVGSGLSLTDTTLTATATGTIGGSTGATDNLLLRSDGTGAATLQNSALQLDDATTSTQANVALINAHSETNSALVLTPKGNGAFIVGPKPDGTATGGNARGTNSIDIQLTRTNANQVASGNSCVVIGTGSRASSNEAVVIGVGATSTNIRSVALGFNATANGAASVSIGELSSSGGANSVALGRITDANLRGMLSTVPFNSVYWGGQTTNNAATILNLDATATNRFTIAANTALAVDILLVARRSDVADKWLVARRFLGIRRDGSNNTSLIGAVQTLGTDQSAGSPTWSFTLTADDTNEALQLEVTGATSETVQWRATAIYRVV